MANWIRAAQARAEQATPGPWVGMFDGDTQYYIACSGLETVAYGNHCATDGSVADIQFIAAARSDVPRLCAALLEAVEALGAIADEHCAFGWGMKCDAVIDECAACRARRVLTRIQSDPEVEHG